MPKETMTSKERWLAVLKRQKPDRLPVDYWATAEVTKKMLKHLGLSKEREMFKKLHIDVPVGVGGRYVGPAIPKDCDAFGIKYKAVDYGSGSYTEAASSPLASYETVEEIEKNYKWPSPDWWDYSTLPSQLKGFEEYPVAGGYCEPFLIYKWLRGGEQAFIDLAINPEICNYILDKLYGLAFENIKRIYEAIPGKVTYSYVAEDVGGQEDLMYSPEHIRQYFLPRMKKVIDFVHQGGAYSFHHTDGAVRKIIPDLIATGHDILNPVQWRCKGMEREGLVKDFGDKLIFHSAVDNQQTIPFGTPEDVKKEVAENVKIFGRGYIIGPCHNLQPVTPVENIIALYEAAHEQAFNI
ncbi:MAG: uroporphyrinogen-III decarboxylase-like protein [Candidatus Firestonebacteria bacterium RIFOXYC2_FULL_39_67]|nr:MAG: uroporphyrinogen-III decarboxylase-like protein [Candidatus Firestonebacteria bacterium RIFOXYD2_FULL_39_29]OGF54433.1 MAG: uroporphyrinogen-III decarboxylase-like protein [Candidatus Firestonebacteria bacterium RIFOXYC2_FULL_39_67]OGF56429.1 MAG: uroporphyrinogen-III decarboxylase-like protein [Candidatus Firestonebacteria bacterium RifOxyC12_full_39_7]